MIPHPLLAQLADERRRRGLSQAAVAQRAGLSRSSVEAWEGGAMPTLAALQCLLDALGLRVVAIPADAPTPSTTGGGEQIPVRAAHRRRRREMVPRLPARPARRRVHRRPAPPGRPGVALPWLRRRPLPAAQSLQPATRGRCRMTNEDPGITAMLPPVPDESEPRRHHHAAAPWRRTVLDDACRWIVTHKGPFWGLVACLAAGAMFGGYLARLHPCRDRPVAAGRRRPRRARATPPTPRRSSLRRPGPGPRR